MSSFVDLPRAKAHLNYLGLQFTATEDDYMGAVLDAAESAVLSYLKTDAPDPSPAIPHAILLQFAELWRFRGDDENGIAPKADAPGGLSPQIERLLWRLRDPALK